jgi:hypothetical protein
MSAAVRKMKRARVRQLARDSAAIFGCICRPDVVHRGEGVTVLHDSWCPAQHAPTTLLIVPRSTLEPRGCDR